MMTLSLLSTLYSLVFLIAIKQILDKMCDFTQTTTNTTSVFSSTMRRFSTLEEIQPRKKMCIEEKLLLKIERKIAMLIGVCK